MQLLDRKLRLISSVKAEQEAATQGNIDPDQVRKCRRVPLGAAEYPEYARELC